MSGYFVTLIGDSVDNKMPGAKAFVARAGEDTTLKEASYRLVPAIALTILGAVLFKKHRVLGALGGGALGGSLYPLSQGHYATAAATMAPAAAGIALSLKWPKHKVWGYVIADVSALAAIASIEAARRA